MNTIPNLSQYILSLNDKNTKTLFQMFKDELKNSTEYFSTKILLNFTDKDDFDNRCQEILINGYEHFFKIKTLLEILHISDQSQTHKYKYEECLNFVVGINGFIDSIHELYIGKHEIEIQKYISIATMNQNNYHTELSNAYIDLVESKKKLMFHEEIDILVNYINQYILQIFKINQIIKNIEIY